MRWLTFISLCSALLVVAPAAMVLRDKLKCPTRQLPGGRVRIRGKGRVAKYICLRGYQVLGDKYSTCVRGRWDTPVPTCIKTGCIPIDVPHGQVLETYRGAFVTIHCDPGYSLVGTQSLYCNGAHWNDTAPVCREIKATAQKSCDFEAETLCGWTHDANHDFDWRRHNFATPSGHVGTGPSFDHTLGPGLNGHYMYLETSSPRLENDTARLFSPVFTAPTNPDSCFIFWYHMYGLTTGSLNVYIYNQDTVLLFSESGDQGDQWKEAVVPLPQANSSFQIVIEGVRGTGFEGDTAVDDVKLTEGEECWVATVSTPSEEETSQAMSDASCEDRCFNRSADPSECECTSDCVSNNTCCPDFLQICHIPSPAPVLPILTNDTSKWNSTSNSSLPTTTAIISNLPTKSEMKTNSSTLAILTPPTTEPGVVVPVADKTSSKKAEFHQTTSLKLPNQQITTTITPKTYFVNISEITYKTSTSISTEYSNRTSQEIPLFEPKDGNVSSTLLPSIKIPTSSTKTPPTYTSTQFQTKKAVAAPPTVAQFQTTTLAEPPKITQFITKIPTESSSKKPAISPTVAQFQTNPLIKIGQTTAKPPPSATLKQNSSLELIDQSDVTKIRIFSTQKPTIGQVTFRSQRKPYFALPTRKSNSRSSNSSGAKNRLVFKTTPTIVFRTPKIIKNDSVTFPTSTFRPKPIKNATLQNDSKSKNDVLHPVWDTVTLVSSPPHIPGMKSKTIHSPNQPTFTTTFTALQKPQNSGNASTTSEIKWKSKYKPLNGPPIHAQYAIASPPNHLIHIIVLVCVVLLSTVLVTVCVVRRRKINRRSIKDDELDIRFLACDEILDFTLARPNDDAQVCETRR